MANPLTSAGTSAQILTHARFDRAPVVQTRRRGRLPRSVPNVWRYGFDKRVAAMENEAHAKELETHLGTLAFTERLGEKLRYEIAVLQQHQPINSARSTKSQGAAA